MGRWCILVLAWNPSFLGTGFQFIDHWLPLRNDSGRKKLLIESTGFSAKAPPLTGLLFLLQSIGILPEILSF